MAKYEIVAPDGRKRIVDDDDDDRILPDGYALRVPMMARDSMTPLQKSVADASVRFGDGGGRPGSQFDFAAAAAHKERAYLDAKAELSDAWWTPPVADRRRWHRVTSRDPQGRETGMAEWEEEDSAPVVAAEPTYDAAEGLKRKQAAYDEMVADMCSAWKGNRA